MAFFLFFSTQKPRKFDYKPVYYDKEADEREERKKAILGPNYKEAYKSDAERAANSENGERTSNIHFRRGLIADRRHEQRNRSKTILSVVILLGLLFAAYWIISTTFFR